MHDVCTERSKKIQHSRREPSELIAVQRQQRPMFRERSNLASNPEICDAHAGLKEWFGVLTARNSRWIKICGMALEADIDARCVLKPDALGFLLRKPTSKSENRSQHVHREIKKNLTTASAQTCSECVASAFLGGGRRVLTSTLSCSKRDDRKSWV